MQRFGLRYDWWCGWLLGLFGGGRRVSRVVVTDDAVDVRMGFWFRGVIERSQIVDVARGTGRVWGWGAHGWRGRWLVNGSSHGLVTLAIEPAGRARVIGVPVKLRELTLSLEDPAGFAESLGMPLAQLR